jgi:hypothetical protein
MTNINTESNTNTKQDTNLDKKETSTACITRSNFPTANQLKNQLYEKHFDTMLNIIFTKIIESNNSRGSSSTIRLLNSDFNNGLPNVPAIGTAPATVVPVAVPVPVPVNSINIPNNVIVDVKKFLTDKGYTIVETEDAAGVSIGWRLSW